MLRHLNVYLHAAVLSQYLWESQKQDTQKSYPLFFRMDCWHCGNIYRTQKILKNNVSSVHGGLTVICPFCQTEQTFKRLSDLKVHVRKFYESECSKMPAEMFSENNGYWCSVKPESYSRLVKLSSVESPVAVNMRLLVLQWSERLRVERIKDQRRFSRGLADR